MTVGIYRHLSYIHSSEHKICSKAGELNIQPCKSSLQNQYIGSELVSVGNEHELTITHISIFQRRTHSFNFKLERFCMCPKFHLIFYMLPFIQNNIWWCYFDAQHFSIQGSPGRYFKEARMNTDLTQSLILTSIDFTTVHLRWHVCVWHKSFHTVNFLVTKDSLG